MASKDRSKNSGPPRKQSRTSQDAKQSKNLGKRQAAEELPRPRKVQLKDGPTKAHHSGSKPAGSTRNTRFQKPCPQNGHKHAAEGTQGTLSKKQRKAVTVAKLSATKKNFNLIQSAVHQWEKARPKATSEQDRQKLVSVLVAKVKGKVLELANHHSASRVIQFCLKHGSAEDKQTVLAEIKPKVVDLARSKYGHYLARKLINICSKNEVPGLVKMFRGHVVTLARHPFGADVLMDLYDVASTQERNAMRAEFYGREFALFDGVETQAGSITGPQQLLENATAAKRRSIFQHMYKSLMPIMEKALLHPPMVHRLIGDFLLSAPTSLVEDAVDTLCQTGGEVFKMVHTHEGSAAVCMLLAYGSAKARRHLLKGMKGFVRDISCNEWGHAAVCMALGCVDDTALMHKTIVQELQAALSELVEHKHGCKVLLQLLSPDNPRYLPPHVLSMLHPPTRITTARQASSSAAAAGAQWHGEEDFQAAAEVAAGVGDDDGYFGGLNKVSAKSKQQNGQAAKVAGAGGKGRKEQATRNEEEDEEGSAAQKAKLTLLPKKLRMFDEDEDTKKEDGEDEDEDAEGEEEEGVALEAKLQTFEDGEEGDDEEEEGEDDGCGDEDKEEDMEEEYVRSDATPEDDVESKVPTVLGLSRKDGVIRRRELLSAGKVSLATRICEVCWEGGAGYLRHPVSCDLMMEVCRGGQDGLLSSIHPTGVAAVHKVVKQEAAQPKDGQAAPEAAPGPALQHVLLDYYASRALRRLILHVSDTAAASGDAAAADCVNALWNQALKGKCKSWFGTHADKVLSAFVFVADSTVKNAAVKELEGLVKGDVSKWAQGFVRGDWVKAKH